MTKPVAQKSPPKSVSTELHHALVHFDRAVEAATTVEELEAIKAQLQQFQKEISA